MTMAKGIMIVDGQRVPFDGEKNVLSVIRKAGIDMPTFCYYSELSVHGACRMCIVENVKTGKIDASCSMDPREGRWTFLGKRKNSLKCCFSLYFCYLCIYNEADKDHFE